MRLFGSALTGRWKDRHTVMSAGEGSWWCPAWTWTHVCLGVLTTVGIFSQIPQLRSSNWFSVTITHCARVGMLAMLGPHMPLHAKLQINLGLLHAADLGLLMLFSNTGKGVYSIYKLLPASKC